MSVEWEMFYDIGYYDMWAVRPIGDKSMNSPRLFHFAKEDDARKFLSLIHKSNHGNPSNALGVENENGTNTR